MIPRAMEAPGGVAVAAHPVSALLAESLLARTPPESLTWNYENALLLLAADRAGRTYDIPSLRNASRRFVDANVGEAGLIEGYSEAEHNLDFINPGRLLLLHPESKSPRIRAALRSLEAQLDSQPRCECGGFWHKRIYPFQMWLDGLYMAQPFAAAFGRRYGRVDFLDDAVRQMAIMEERARDPRTGLLYHGWDESRRQLWCRPDTGRSPTFWGRAMGWYAMALVEVLDYLPSSHEGRLTLSASLGRLAEAARRFQDPASGLWHQVADQGARSGNYAETSVSAMFAYAFAKANRRALLRGEPAVRAALSAARAREGIERLMVRQDSRGPVLEGICAVAGLGGDPYRD
ncbi:MAG TPA: glycoside hydrolase family 88 protein, partial [Magnetospirillaceae bacterium]|nr:glycoside hydrolase family 88 protein [Magnetospirillaceae bacterium]